MTDCGVSQVGCDVVKYLVTEYLVPGIRLHFDYWYCFDVNVQCLRDEINRLITERRHMDQKFEEARLRAETPTAEIENLSKDGDQKCEEAARILQVCDGLKAWNIISRYSWGERAQKMAKAIEKLRNEVVSVTSTTFGSRRRVEEDIMKFLKDDRVCMIAICGGGGIGKTTMVRRIEDRVRKENLFDEVVHVVISQQFDKRKTQEEIAELLGLGFSEVTLVGRAHKLHTRLQDSKRKLIIFDDVWEFFKLDDIGVPSGHGSMRCKIILTSRVRDACDKMGAQKIIPMDLLTEEEAWNLFKERAGSCVENPDILPIAKDVAAEFQGLPIALVTVGNALRYKGIRVWKDFHSQLKRSMPIDIPGVIKEVYMPLKLSFDFLENQSVRSFLLLCGMFPEDYSIPIELLTFYGIGLDIFERITTIDEGRNITHKFVEQLKSHFLLLDGDETHSVKMHDVVRDAAIFIGSNETNGFLKCLEVSSMDFSSKDLSSDCTWMSIDFRIDIDKLCVGSNFPNLRLLMIRGSYSRDGNIICFEGMKGLNMLSISDKNLRPLLPTLKLLKKLSALHLVDCSVEDISVLGELASLEILCIHNCDDIEVLPADIGRLTRLRLLELSYCKRLKRIVAGVISSLVGLEELKIVESFKKWEAQRNQSGERNACLSELESLPNLTSLEIDISDYNLFAEQICFSQKLVRYHINYVTGDSYDEREYDRSIRLYLPGEVTVGNWILQLVRTTQSLELQGDGSNYLIVAEIESLRSLFISNSTMKKLVYGMDCKLPVLVHLELIRLTELEEIVDGTIPEGFNSFQRLESLHVVELPKLAHLWKRQNQNVSLGNLKSMFIIGCTNLRYLFSMATARSLVQLQRLKIRRCDKMEQVVWNEMEMCDEIKDEGERHIIFPKLERLGLDNLPRLTSFCGGTVEGIKFPKLEEMWVGNLPRLESLLPLDLEATHDHHSLHFFCHPKVETPRLRNISFLNLHDTINKIWCRHVPINFFHNLERLFIDNVHGIKNLISFSIAVNLVNLKYLTVEGCQEMDHVIEDEKEVHAMPLFHNLEKIVIGRSYKLKSFCQSKHALELLSLKEVKITDCPGMKTFTLGFLSTPGLYVFKVDCKEVETKDLNDGIRDRFRIKASSFES